jgi:hypothetical protein
MLILLRLTSQFPLKPIAMMRPFLFSAALILIASSNVYATEALFFDGGGYSVDILIGMAPDPVIASVRFTPQGTKDRVSLPRELLHVEKFDMEKRISTMHFSNKNNPDLPASFSLSVKRPGLSSLLAAKKLVMKHSLRTFNATTKFSPNPCSTRNKKPPRGEA